METESRTIHLSHLSLTALMKAYGFPLPKRGLVLVGLRGAEPVRAASGLQAKCDLVVQGVDYLSLHCTLAIWDLDRKQVFASLGSTIPHLDQVAKAAARKGRLQGKGTNQVEPGWYTDLTKGEHLQGKEKGHAALRQTAYRFYRRSKHAPPYRTTDALYYGNPYDNLHCAWNLDGKDPGYSSAGCLVVAGLPHCPRIAQSGPNQGSWKIFHDLLYASPQKQFPFALLSGREALAILSEADPKPRLLFGSEGKAVTALQQKLIAKGLLQGRPTGKLGTATYRAWNAAGLRGYGDVLGCG
jgi:hypothetical protein